MNPSLFLLFFLLNKCTSLFYFKQFRVQIQWKFTGFQEMRVHNVNQMLKNGGNKKTCRGIILKHNYFTCKYLYCEENIIRIKTQLHINIFYSPPLTMVK